MSHPDLGALHTAMRAQVDQQFLPGLSIALLRGREVVDRFCYGQADREANVALRIGSAFSQATTAAIGRLLFAAWLLTDEGPLPRSKRTQAKRSAERLLAASAVVQFNMSERPRSV